MQREFLEYLVAHQDAKDTVEGILQWWLIDAEARVRATDMSAALEELVARGWITVTSVGQHPPLYGLNRARLQEIRQFLLQGN